jgi:regulator of protease activity HflC (stomatin/prohibitin superfamily)
MILEAEGDKAAAIARAEGTKQSAILEAEGQATAIKEIASAERSQKILIAEGEAQAIRNVFGAIHDGGPTHDLITIRYLEALKYVADGNATKIFMPLEMQGLASSAGMFGEMLESTLKSEAPAK